MHATPDRKPGLPAELNEDLYSARTEDTQVESEGAREADQGREEGRRVEMRGGRTAPSLHSLCCLRPLSRIRIGWGSLGRSPIFNAHGARRTSANLESK